MIYIYIFVYLCVLCYLERILKLNKRLSFILCSIPLIFTIIFIRNIPDYEAYLKSYNLLNNLNDNYHINLEIGYLYISKIFYFWGLNYHFFRIILLGFILAVFSKILLDGKNLTVKFLLFYTTTFIFTVLVQYRSGLSLALFCLYGIPLLKKNKKGHFLFLIFLLSFFHKSIFLFVPLIFLKDILKKRDKIILLFIALLIPYFYSYILKILEKGAEYISFFNKLNNYLKTPWWFDINATFGRRDYFTISLCLFFIIFLKKVSKEENIYFWIFYLCILYKGIFIKIPEVGFRAYLLCQFSLVILVPKFLTKRYYIRVFVIQLVTFIYFYLLISSYGGGKLLN